MVNTQSEKQSIENVFYFVIAESDIFSITKEDVKKITDRFNTDNIENIYNLAKLFVIIYCVCEYYNISYDNLCSSSRKSILPLARRMYSYLCRTKFLKNESLAKIGEFINIDHSSVSTNILKIQTAIEDKSEDWCDYLNILDNIKELLVKYNISNANTMRQ